MNRIRNRQIATTVFAALTAVTLVAPGADARAAVRDPEAFTLEPVPTDELPELTHEPLGADAPGAADAEAGHAPAPTSTAPIERDAAPPTGPYASPPMNTDLADVRVSMQQELVALEDEFTALAGELGECDESRTFAQAITEVEARLQKLREDGERLDALLARLRARATPPNPAGIP